MSRYTDFNDFYFCGVSYRNRGDIETDSTQAQRAIDNIKQKLLMMICGNIKDFVPEKDENGYEIDKLEWINNKFNEEWEYLDELMFDKARADLALSNIDSLVHYEENWASGITKKFVGEKEEPAAYIFKGTEYTPEEADAINLEEAVEKFKSATDELRVKHGFGDKGYFDLSNKEREEISKAYLADVNKVREELKLKPFAHDYA